MRVASKHDPNQRVQQLEMPLADDVVNQVLGGGGQHQARHAVDDHQHQAQREQCSTRPDELPDLRQRLEDFGLFCRCGWTGRPHVVQVLWIRGEELWVRTIRYTTAGNSDDAGRTGGTTGVGTAASSSTAAEIFSRVRSSGTIARADCSPISISSEARSKQL